MRLHDPWGWNDWSGRDNEPVGPNEEHLIRWGLTVALSLFFASLYPADLVLVMLGAFLLLGAVGAAVAAGVRGEEVFAPHLTRWDEAAASAALGLAALIAAPVLQAPACA